MKVFLFFSVLLMLAQPISTHAKAGNLIFENKALNNADNESSEVHFSRPANGEGLFKVGLIIFGTGAAAALVGSAIRWTSQDAAVKQKAGYIQFSGLCLMGIPLGISITSNNGRTSVSSTRRSRGNKHWRR